MDNISLVVITYIIITVILVTALLVFTTRKKTTKYKRHIDDLEKRKNQIISSPILIELAKVETLVKNRKMEEKYNLWKEKIETIKSDRIPKITDMLLEIDFLLENKDYKNANAKIAKLEMEIYKVESKSDILMKQIKGVTLSEEQNRSIITKLKAIYREQSHKFNTVKSDYADIAKPIELQLENIEKRFQDFEKYMEQNDYDEVSHIVKALDEMIKHIKRVVEEVPTINLLGANMLPKKIDELMIIYNRMIRDNYVLDYLNIEYNIGEVNKKVSTIFDKTRVLNLEDSVFELKTMLDYVDSLFIEFEKEKQFKNKYYETLENYKDKLNKTNNIMSGFYLQLDDLKVCYDLNDEDLGAIDGINKELLVLNEDTKLLESDQKNKKSPFSKLVKDQEVLSQKLYSVSDKLERFISSVGNMKEDEQRAKEQLEEIKTLLSKAKFRIRDYKLPVLPNNYYVELSDATKAIREIIKELEKKPISINTLNTRVDTARDLAFKLFNTTTEMVKTASLAEMAIIYGNRYRSVKPQIEEGLNHAEILFNNGDYKRALEITIGAIDLIEPGIYKKLLAAYSDNK